MSTCKVTFIPSAPLEVRTKDAAVTSGDLLLTGLEKTIRVPKGTEVLNAALACGVYINSSCGGEGMCGRCKVIVQKGDVRTEPTGRISKEERERGYFLACRTTIHSDVKIEIPPESRLDKQQILTDEAKVDRLAGIYTEGVEVEYAKGIKVGTPRPFPPRHKTSSETHFAYP